MQVREISCGKMHELAIALDKAGFDSDMIQKIISSKENKMAETMYASVVEKQTTSEPTEKFALLVDLGVITVPDDYVHGKCLKMFNKKNHKKFYYYNENITDENFSKATTKLMPGRKFMVKAFKQIVSGNTTSEERMAFLKSQNAVLTGAQGASLVFEQKRDELPKSYWYASFDEKEALWKDSDGRRRVPGVGAGTDGGFEFSLGRFEDVWYGGHAFLCFCDLPANEVEEK